MKKISTERLAELLKAEYKLDLLQAGGVDNWDGYDVSLSCEYDDETESYFDLKKKSDEEITSEVVMMNISVHGIAQSETAEYLRYIA